MFPLFFGPHEDGLYGVCHSADPSAARSLGMVVCQPLLHEADDCHRALRSLAEQLARAGVDVLRFDYHGTGDSAGDAEEGSVEHWVRDAQLAAGELRASRGLDAVGYVGLRFGASLAALAAASADDEPACLVLWEPVVLGAPYVADLRHLQQAWLAHEAEERPGAPRLATPDEVVGYPFTPAFAAGLEAVDLLSGPAPRARRTLLVDEGHGGEALDALEARLQRDGLAPERRRIDGGAIWRREFDGEQAQVPRALLLGVVDWITGGAAS